MANRTILNLPHLGIVTLEINDDNLYNFFERQFRDYIVENIRDNLNNFVRISIDSHYFHVMNCQLSRSIKFQSNYLQFVKNSKTQKLNFQYDLNGSIIVSIDFQKKQLHYLKSLIKTQYSMNHILFYQTILYPIFSLYSMIGNYFSVHGSLIKVHDKYIVLTGLDGVGKSSLTTELALLGHKVLADNFLLFNGNTFVGLNMPLRLDLDNPINENIIYQDSNLKEVLFQDIEQNAINANKVFFMVIGDELSMTKIDTNTAMFNWNLINNGAGEILDANLFCLPFLYQNMGYIKSCADENLEFFMLSIPKGKIKDGVKEILCQLNI